MQNALQNINSLLKQGRIDDAEALCKKVIEVAPQSEHGWIQLGRIAQMKGDLSGMLKAASKALQVAPTSMVAHMQEAEASLLNGDMASAGDKLANLEKMAASDARILQHIAELYSHMGQYDDAMRCYEQAQTVIGDNPELLYNMATAASALGLMDEAEVMLDKLIKQNPHDYAAYYNRAVLKKQTKDHNHISEMEGLKPHEGRGPGGDAQLGYALAKEYEDLGDYEKSFENLKYGADSRKQLLSYDVAGDEATMAEITAVMTVEFFEDCPAATNDTGPIFILGQPRSGTTLVDRILSSHSEVESLGEINDFALALMAGVGQASDKLDLVRKTAQIDFAKLGAEYERSISERGTGPAYLIDKTPANFLYIGLIAKAFPNAKIVHLRRNPMDSCYAMYKTLFRMGYPFSYNLEDLARYYIAYHQLMEHWRSVLPGRIFDLDYEALVADQEGCSRALLDHCGLAWEDECLDFHKNKSAAATASAAQVRQPIYTSSVAKWRNYETELAPLAATLTAAGIDVEAK